MKKLMLILAMGLLAGCATESVQGPAGGAQKPEETQKPERKKDDAIVCRHTDQPIYKFEKFSDGHHFLFDSDGKLQASVNTKYGVLRGAFEIYHFTGNREYWGILDAGGHVITGKYNRSSSDERSWDVRDMNVADKQNAQSRLVDIMRTGIDKMNEASGEDITVITTTQEMKNSLRDYAHISEHPVVGEEYMHNGRNLQVFCLFDGGVLVRDNVSSRYLDIAVETTEKYVDDEMLMAGKYIYIGPWTYTTVENKQRTIRRFKQVE